MHQHVSKYCPQTSHRPPDPAVGVIFFFKTWLGCISNQGESRMQQHGRKYLSAEPPPPPPHLNLMVKSSNSTFSEQYHVAYQIKRNYKCRNNVTNILPEDRPHHDHGVGVKMSKLNFIIKQSCCISKFIFSEMVILNIKLNGIMLKYSTMVAIFCP